jgi:hypothetical protein
MGWSRPIDDKDSCALKRPVTTNQAHSSLKNDPLSALGRLFKTMCIMKLDCLRQHYLEDST